MKLGNFDRYIVIESYTEAADSYGEKVQTWTTYHSTFANMNTTGGTEQISADELTGKLNVDWTIRYKSGINEKMRVNYGSNYYQITAVLLEGRDNRMILQSYRL
jgi:SPP1 family predicted phage head-tail adaptor